MTKKKIHHLINERDESELSTISEMVYWEEKGIEMGVVKTLETKELSKIIATYLVSYDEMMEDEFKKVSLRLQKVFTKNLVSGQVLVEVSADEVLQFLTKSITDDGSLLSTLSAKIRLKQFMKQLER